MRRIRLIIPLWFVIPEISLYTRGEKELYRAQRTSLRLNKKFLTGAGGRHGAADSSSVF